MRTSVLELKDVLVPRLESESGQPAAGLSLTAPRSHQRPGGVVPARPSLPQIREVRHNLIEIVSLLASREYHRNNGLNPRGAEAQPDQSTRWGELFRTILPKLHKRNAREEK